MTKTMHQTDEEAGKAGNAQKETFSQRLARETKQKLAKSKPAKTPKTSWQVLQNVLGAGVIVATLFTIWTPSSLLAGSLQNQIMKALSAQNQDVDALIEEGMPADFPLDKIGIVVGHKGNDSGAVCSNGLTEVEVNNNVATFVQQKLSKMGYEVELLEEFDPRLDGYQAGLLLSIHSDSCDYINDSATGFKVAAALSETKTDNSARLVSCMADRYQKITNLPYHYQSITTDMTYYHAFNEIDPFTTAGIIEIGFMNLDMKILTEEPELIADGIVEGIRCYMNNESIEPTPTMPPAP